MVSPAIAIQDLQPDLVALREPEFESHDIRVANDGDAESIIMLVSKMTRQDARPRYEWLYRNNPHGKALTWLARERSTGQPVGVTSLFPRRVVVNGRERVGSIGGDCYIVPRARRRGLATLLHRASFSQMRSHGVDFMYGPPRIQNLGALLKAGSQDVACFRRFTRPITALGALASLSNVLPASATALSEGVTGRLVWASLRALEHLSRADTGNHRLERVERFDDSFSALSARIAPMYPFTCVRDAEYLQWRYFECGARTQTPYAVRDRGELVGLVVLELGTTSAVFVDLLVEPEPSRIDAILQLAIDGIAAAGRSRADPRDVRLSHRAQTRAAWLHWARGGRLPGLGP